MKYTWMILALCACSKSPPEPAAQAPVLQPPIVAVVAPPAPVTAAVGEAPMAKPTNLACPRDPAPEAFKPSVFELGFAGATQKLMIELVHTAEDSAHGLMYRPSMSETSGMLFKLKNEVHTFWMHNTCIALDMLFLDDAGVVLGILENVPPMNDEIRTIGVPSTYVLELNAGFCGRNKITRGSRLLLNSTIRGLKVQ